MDLTYVECFLTNCLGSSPEFAVEQLSVLLKEIKEFKHTEEYKDNIYNDLATINNFEKIYKKLCEENLYVEKNGTIEQKIKKVREIMSYAQCLNLYITSILEKPNLSSLSSNNNDGTYIRKLISKKDEYKEQRFHFGRSLDQLNTELRLKDTKIKYRAEKLRLGLED